MYQAIAPLIDHPTDEPGWRLAQWPWIVVAVDALIGVGRVDTARAELDELATVIAAPPSDLSAVDLARLSGRLAEADGDLEQAERHYRAGADARDGLPYGRGRVLLAYGRLLRRMGRRGDAVDQLRRARAELAALGATPTSARATRSSLRVVRWSRPAPRITSGSHRLSSASLTSLLKDSPTGKSPPVSMSAPRPSSITSGTSSPSCTSRPAANSGARFPWVATSPPRARAPRERTGARP